MKKTLILITLLLSLNSFNASLKFTKNPTESLENDKKYIIKYQKEKHEWMDGSSYIQFSDSDYNLDNLYSQTGLDNIQIYQGDHPTKEVANTDHTTTMIRAFKNAVGDDWFFKNKDRYYVMSSFTNPRWWSGIIINSKFGVFGGRSYFSSDGIYFGDVINEVLIGKNGSRRVFTDDTDNRNLFISSLSNSTAGSDFKSFHNKSNTKKGDVIFPATETMIFPSFGTEAQKLIRSDKIFVGEYVCRPQSFFEWEYDVPKRIASQDKIEFETNPNDSSNKCNFAGEKGEIANFALYNRAATVLSNGDVKKSDGYGHGTSYAAPKVGGYASLIQQKFPNMNYMQIKQVLLTTAYRFHDQLDNISGWGVVDINKALKGPSNLNAGLIEEEKFYTGRYDKIFDNKGNIYFYADVENNNNWKWENDISGGLTEVPTSELTYNLLMNYDQWKIANFEQEKSVIEKMNIQPVIASEYNYYEKLSKYKSGLRKAGNGTLTTTGNLYYKGPTQVLQGTLEIAGNVPSSPVWVFEDGTLVLNGSDQNLNEVNADGGLIKVYGTVHIKELALTKISDIKLYGKNSSLIVDKLITTPELAKKIKNLEDVTIKNTSEVNDNWGANDVVINEYKVMDLPREFYFSNFKNEINNYTPKKSYNKIYEELKKRYQTFRESDESIKKEVPGYKNGSFAIENDSDYSGFDKNEYSDNMIGLTSSVDDLNEWGANFKFVPLQQALQNAKKPTN